MRLSAKSATAPSFKSDFVNMPPPSTKVIRLKSTCSWRERLAVVVLHSISTLPDATISIRFSVVTGTQLSLRLMPSCF